MADTYTTKIDERYRPGALKGLVKPRENYEVRRVSEVEFTFRLMAPATMPRPKLVKRNGRTLLSGNPITQAAVDKALEEFP